MNFQKNQISSSHQISYFLASFLNEMKWIGQSASTKPLIKELLKPGSGDNNRSDPAIFTDTNNNT